MPTVVLHEIVWFYIVAGVANRRVGNLVGIGW